MRVHVKATGKTYDVFRTWKDNGVVTYFEVTPLEAYEASKKLNKPVAPVTKTVPMDEVEFLPEWSDTVK